MSALLFGSISTLADTSELQREAFNTAFAQHGLDWEWSQDEYAELLTSNGGADRVAAYAKDRGVEVDAAAVHATKSETFQRLVGERGIEPRPGVLETIQAASDAGDQVGFVTTTSPENVAAVLGALSPAITDGTFDVVLDWGSVQDGQTKPDPTVYRLALEQLGVDAADAVAIEDNEGGVAAATAAGVACVAFPNTNTAGGDFADASAIVDRLEPDAVRALAGSAA